MVAVLVIYNHNLGKIAFLIEVVIFANFTHQEPVLHCFDDYQRPESPKSLEFLTVLGTQVTSCFLLDRSSKIEVTHIESCNLGA